jgi:hypothetical protein
MKWIFWLALSKVFYPPAALFTLLAWLSMNAMDYFEDRSKSCRPAASAN